MLGMSPVFPTFASGEKLASGGESYSAGRRRTKSVITPDARRRGLRVQGEGKYQTISFHETFGLHPGSDDPGLSPNAWMVSVKVSPTLESGEPLVNGLLPPDVGLEGGTSVGTGVGAATSSIGFIGTGQRSGMGMGMWQERIEFSNALKTINSKFKGEIPLHQPVAVSKVNATAQLVGCQDGSRGSDLPGLCEALPLFIDNIFFWPI